MKHNGRVLTLLALLTFLSAAPAAGQAGQQSTAATDPQQSASGGDLIRQLNLTPEQREQIRSIRQANQEERAGINQRVRDAKQALDRELDSERPNEALVEQRTREVGAAQAEAMRMRILTEVRIRKVLTSEQLLTLRNLRQQARQQDRERLREGRQQQRRQALDGTRGLQNQPNEPKRLLRRRDLRRARP